MLLKLFNLIRIPDEAAVRQLELNRLGNKLLITNGKLLVRF